jgi:hypothetical protein
MTKTQATIILLCAMIAVLLGNFFIAGADTANTKMTAEYMQPKFRRNTRLLQRRKILN